MGREKDRMTVGIGCFAAGGTLTRVLRKAVENYILGKWDDFQSAGLPLSEGTRLLSRVMAGDTPGEAGTWPERITGFHLVYKNQRLNLSIFSRAGHAETSTFSLDELTQVRRLRLN
jgi:hypothetical protein